MRLRVVLAALALAVASPSGGAASGPPGGTSLPHEQAASDTLPGPRGECTRCHRGLEESRLAIPARAFGESAHARAGFDCVACHGGDATARREEEAHQGVVHRPARSRIPELCSRCHSNAWYMHRYDPDLRVDQLQRYRTSVHGQRLFGLGDTRVAVCTDCHSAHFITPPSEERSSVHPPRLPGTCGGCHANPRYMAPYDIGTHQLRDYRQSVHWERVAGGDHSAPVCNDCHGNHGAAPPDVEWIGEVCSQCHSRIGNFYAASPHDSVFAYLGQPGCATCHGNHAVRPATDAMLALDGQGVCGGSGCHAPGDSAGRVVLAMRSAIDSLTAVFERADSILTVAEHAGMPVSEAQFELNRTQTSLVKARAAVHTARLDSVQAAVEAGLEVARGGYERGEQALDELEFRRMGLAVSTVIILVLIAGLLLKIRELGPRPATAGGASDGDGHHGDGSADPTEDAPQESTGEGGP